MKVLKFMSLTALLTLGACDQIAQDEASVALKLETQDEASVALKLETQDEKISYLLGMDNGKNIQSVGMDIDIAAFQKGFAAGIAGEEPAMSEEDIESTVKAFEAQMMAKRDEMQQAEQTAGALQSEANGKDGAAFLLTNGAKEDVVTTASGLQYKVLIAGTGSIPTVASTVEVHYAGSLIDGTEFDSSIKRGVPAQFGVTQVIAGWTEALQLMPEGSKWALYIPADLAYGPGGTGPIGPNSTLIFEVELLHANVPADK